MYCSDQANILLIACVYSETQIPLYMKRSKRGFQFAAQHFQESLIEGFLENGVNLHVLTIPPLSSFPGGYSSPIVNECDYVYNGRVLGKSLGYVNIPFLIHPSKEKALDYLKRWTDDADKKKHIVVYGLHSDLLSIAADYKNEFPETAITVIIPDLPEYMGCNRFVQLLGIQQMDNETKARLLTYSDYHVLLTESMHDKLPVLRPFTVVEGLYHVNDEPRAFVQKEKIVLYTGALSLRYGITDLLHAFELIQKEDYQLWFCGTGDAVEHVVKASKNDKRIQYLGLKTHEETKRLQQDALLLVNPRHSDEEFTLYSFPSKTMEYLASGTPTLMCHLKCIPKEYDNYLYYFDDESAEGMARKIIQICECPQKELYRKGLEARTFIKNNKNPQAQVRKILDLMFSDQ